MIITSLVLLGLLLSTPAHLYDVEGCERLLWGTAHQFAELLYSGISEDNTIYIMQWRLLAVQGRMETHTPIAPRVQWEDPHTPEPVPGPPVAFYLDLDEDGTYEHLFERKGPLEGCEGIVHSRWVPSVNGYVLVLGGKDHT